jgi:uncharacterized protein
MRVKLRGLLICTVIGSLLLCTSSVQAVSPDIVISQIYGGGGNSGTTYTHDFIELFNRGTAPVTLAGWSIQYTSATGTGNFGASSITLTELPNVTLAPGQYLLIQEAQGTGGTTPLPSPDVIDSTPISMSGTGGKVALVHTTTPLGCNGGSTPCAPAALATIVDLVGWNGANFFEGSGAAPATTNTTAVVRAQDGCQETDDNAADFTTSTPNPRNTRSPLHVCTGQTNPVGTGAAEPNSLTAGQATLFTVAVTPGTFPTSTDLAVSCDLTPIGGSATQAFFDDGTSGDITIGDNTFSFLATVATSTVAGDKLLQCTLSDAQQRTGSTSIGLNVYVILPIGTVQGAVGDADDGATFASPYAGQTVVVQGVIYQQLLTRTSSGSSQYGFFIQNTADTADNDANTSDGIFVFMSGFTSLIGGYVPHVGDEIVLQGRVSEFFNLTELSSARALEVVRSGVDLEDEVPAFDVNPPAPLAEANRYWERHEGMRGRVPAHSIVLNGRNVFASTADAEVWVARPDSVIAQRADPYARRAFRDPHTLDDIPNQLFDNGNGYRILLGSLGIKWAADDNQEMIAPSRTFDTLANAPVGGVYYSFGKYAIQPDQQIALSEGVDPALNAPPQAFDRSREYSIATFNMENLYDFRDDPSDGCDFTGNAGCLGVTPPFDYVPASDAAYQARLHDIAQQIIINLHSPDIIMAQEAEDQDMCTVQAGVFTCDKADGKPDTLQELATLIASAGGPAYDAAFDRHGADDRGIVSGFLYRTDRVQLLPAEANDPVLGTQPQVVYRSVGLPYNTDVSNPKALNAVLPTDADTSTGIDGDNVFTRAPQVGHFRLWRDGIGTSVFTDLYAIVNHFSSGPDTRVGQRTEQANYAAALVAALQAADPDVHVIVGGDLNVYPRPDDPFTPGDLLYPSDQLAGLYQQGLTNLWERLAADAPAAAYSYVFQGQAQTLDHLFVTPSLLHELVQIRAAHINSDWPLDFPGDGPRGTSDHDPQVARYRNVPTIERLTALVNYYAASGAITRPITTRVLLKELDRAGRFAMAGKPLAYTLQLLAFQLVVEGFAPQSITRAAANALKHETSLLLALH